MFVGHINRTHASHLTFLLFVRKKMERRIIVKNLWQKGWRKSEIVNHLGKSRSTDEFVRRWLKRLAEDPSITDRSRSGRPRSVRTPQLIKRIKKRFARNPKRSIRNEAKLLKMNRESVRLVVRDDLGLHPYKLRKCGKLSDLQKSKRVERCRLLRRRFSEKSVKKIVFSDEKIFLIEQKLNAQNDRVYVASIKDLPEGLRAVQREQFPGGVMVFAAASFDHKFPLKFVENGVKINGDYYRREVLDGVVKRQAQTLFPDGNWCFLQDGATSHTARLTQQFCEAEFPDFIAKDEWPPNSHDLNIFD